MPMATIPAWAVLERRLFDAVEESWRVFAAKYTEADGRLRFDRSLANSRDGVDDFYEAFEVSESDGLWLDPAERVTIW